MIKQNQIDSTNQHLKNEVNEVKAVANLTKKKVNWVEIEYGNTDEGNYVFHFTDHHMQRTFPRSPKILQEIVNIITESLDKVIPGKEIRFMRTPEDWDKQVFTIKVLDWSDKKFNFNDDRVEEVLDEIGEKISEIIEITVKRRKF